MPKYLIERFIPQAGELTAMELKAIAQQTYLVQQELEARIQWLHSTIMADRMLCLYVADNEATLREHARQSGLPIKQISIVSAIIGPTIEALDDN
jgi:hypothetical protein